jgi:Secretion system C-terminal sorting domain
MLFNSAMRFKILFAFCFFAVLTANAQTYHPVLETNKYWDVLGEGYPTGICSVTYGNRFFISGDTTFQGKKYDVIRSYAILSNQEFFCPPFYVDTVPEDNSFNFYLREDTETKSLFRYPSVLPGDSEELLFDFKSKVGDTIYYGTYPVGVISSIDSIQLLNGEFRRAFYQSHCMGCDSFPYAVEGIGLITGFTIIPPVCECGSQLVCVKKNNIPIFSNPFLGNNSCYFFAGIPETEKKKVEISPNPAEDYFRINIGNEISLPLKLSIYNTEGKRVRYFELQNHEASIDISRLSVGMYIISLSNANLSLTKKLIISR